jgi:hypothetical protein
MVGKRNLPDVPTVPAGDGGDPEPGWYRMTWIGELTTDGTWTDVRTTAERIPGPDSANCGMRLGALRARLVETSLMWRGTAQKLRKTQRLGNIAAGVAYDLAACDVEQALTDDAGWEADCG